jgi:hypothetical protein
MMVLRGTDADGRRPLVQWIRRATGPTIALIVLVVVAYRLRDLDWAAVAGALSGYSVVNLLVALALVLPAIAAVATYDLIGRHATGHAIPVARTMLLSFTGYFFSLNLGAILGGLALRFRLYQRHRLGAITIGQIIALSVLTNWSGFALLAGVVLALYPPDIEGLARLGPALLRLAGVALILTTAAYLAACWLKGGVSIRIRDKRVQLPSFRLALVQIGLSCANWASMAAVIAWLLPAAGWLAVMPVLMASAVAGIWSHVPGGIGVTEAVFVTLLAQHASEPELLAAVLLFRVVYYFIPLVAALAGYAFLEITARRTG